MDDETRPPRTEAVLLNLQHRIKNLVSVIRSVARRTAEGSADVETFQARFDGRLAALTRTYSAMARTTSGQIDLEELLRDALIDAAPGADVWTLDGPRVALSGPLAETLALIAHELAMEASLAGLATQPDGRLDIRWRVEHGRLALDWREGGLAGRAASSDRAFVEELLFQALPYQFNGLGTLETGAEGLICRIEAPLPDAPSP
ncbi:HWE histidine kinase domain-containing protein [Brevundimonas staleyi]|uniref:histidine kinase n=1 Tax=Brevundimonas staleyi TaxID=74326 RepID=A0ABW0FW42_9CAUL